MRRFSTSLVLVALLLFPAAAAAKLFFFEGKGSDDASVKVSFTLSDSKRDDDGKIKFGEKARVEDLEAKNAEFTCTDGDSYKTTVTPGFVVLVTQDGVFNVKSGSPESLLWVIKGQFNDRGNRAQGFFRTASSSVVPYKRTCDTGKVPFSVNLQR